MNDLELIMQSEINRLEMQKRTQEEFWRDQRRKARNVCNEMVKKLSFLSKYDCKVYLDDVPGSFFIDYQKDGHTSVARIKLKCECKKYDGVEYHYFDMSGRFEVDWHSSVCHNDGREYLTIEEIIKGLVKRIS